MNAKRSVLQKVVEILPSLNAPTVSPLFDEDWCSVETIVDRAQVRELVPKLKAAGAEGIIEYALNKVL